MTSFNQRYVDIRQQLDDLNFHQPLSEESLLLVENLLSELCYARENLEHYSQLSRLNKEKNRELESKLIPLKEENERLIKENSSLQLKVLEQQECFCKTKKELKHEIIDLEGKVSDLEFINAEQSIRIKELEEEMIEKTKTVSLKANKEKKIEDQRNLESCFLSGKLKSLNVINEYITNLSRVKSGIAEELVTLKKEKENLIKEVKKLTLKVSESENEILQLKAELKEIVKLEPPPNKVCSCHELDLNFENKSNSKEILTYYEKKKGTKLKGRPETSSSYPDTSTTRSKESEYPKVVHNNSESLENLEMKVKKLEEIILSFQKQVENEWFEKENLKKRLSSLQNEKETLIRNFETVSTAEKNVLNQLDLYIQENAVLKTQIANINKLNGNLKKNQDKINKIHSQSSFGKVSKGTNTKASEKHLIDKGSCTDFFPVNESDTKIKAVKPVEEIIKHQFTENSNIESIIKNQLDEYIKKAKILFPNEIPEKEDKSYDSNKKIHEERDFFCREYQRLKDKLYHVAHNFDKTPSFECPYACLDLISHEFVLCKNTIQELLKSREQLKKKLEMSTCHCCKQNEYTDMKHTVEVKMKNLEVKEAESSSVKERLTNKIQSLQEQNQKYKEKIECLLKDNTQLKSKNNHYKLIQEENEHSMKNLEDAKKMCEAELNCAMSRLKKLENEKNKVEQNNYLLETEKKCLKKNLVHMDHEKDSISNKLDKKTEQIISLEEEINLKKMRYLDLEQKYNKLELSMQTLQEMNSQQEHNLRLMEQHNLQSQEEMLQIKKQNEILLKENRRLKDDLTAATQDCFRTNNELRVTKEEVEELKIKLQSYVSEVRRIEDLLQMKEAERRSMLEQLKGLTLDGSSAHSKSFENSANIPREALNDLQDRLHSYETEVHDKDNLLINMEQEMENLKTRVKQLEGQLEHGNRNEFNSSNDLCTFLENQKKSLCDRISELESDRKELKERLSKVTNENLCLQENIKQAHSSSAVLENLLTVSQREAVELESKNKDLITRLEHVESSVQELRSELELTNPLLPKNERLKTQPEGPWKKKSTVKLMRKNSLTKRSDGTL